MGRCGDSFLPYASQLSGANAHHGVWLTLWESRYCFSWAQNHPLEALESSRLWHPCLLVWQEILHFIGTIYWRNYSWRASSAPGTWLSWWGSRLGTDAETGGNFWGPCQRVIVFTCVWGWESLKPGSDCSDQPFQGPPVILPPGFMSLLRALPPWIGLICATHRILENKQSMTSKRCCFNFALLWITCCREQL